jgi:hypothetical protein
MSSRMARISPSIPWPQNLPLTPPFLQAEGCVSPSPYLVLHQERAERERAVEPNHLLTRAPDSSRVTNAPLKHTLINPIQINKNPACKPNP